MKRPTLDAAQLDLATTNTRDKMYYRLKQKGDGCFVSSHEILGSIVEEVDEYREAVHKNLSDREKIEELTDIAVACLIGIASINSGGTQW